MERPPIYTEPNRILGEFYVREIKRTGTQRQTVHYIAVGLHRVGTMPRHQWERLTKPA